VQVLERDRIAKRTSQREPGHRHCRALAGLAPEADHTRDERRQHERRDAAENGDHDLMRHDPIEVAARMGNRQALTAG